jgi:site-specific recombinase XerD
MMVLPPEAAAFIDALETEKYCSKHTILSYTYTLNHYCAWLEANNFTFDSVDMRQYVLHLKTTLKNISVKQRVACLKSFYNYLDRECVPVFPKRLKIDEYPILTLSTAQVQALLDSVCTRRDSVKSKLSASPASKLLTKQLNNCFRDLAIITLLVGTGMRVGELVKINISDIDFNDASILIHGKGNKLRHVFFDVPAVKQPLLDYMLLRNNLTAGSGALFLNSKSFSRISTRSVQRMLKLYLALANLPSSVSPHTLRHSYATISIENGANIKAISSLLGHSHVKTTLEYYTHLSKDYLRKVFVACHPCSPNDISITAAMQNRSALITSYG